MGTFSSDLPDEFITNNIKPIIKPFLINNRQLIKSRNEFFNYLEILDPTISQWSAIMDAEARITSYGVKDIKILSLKTMDVEFGILYKTRLVAYITARLIYSDKTKKVIILNKEDVISSINLNICPICNNPTEYCNCHKSNPEIEKEEPLISPKFFHLSKRNLKVEDESEIFSKKEIVYKLPKEIIEEIINGFTKTFGYKKTDLWHYAEEILQENPDMNESNFATKLISKFTKGNLK